MTPSDYIKHQLELWNTEFVGIHIRYAYDVEANFHMVEIDPEAIRRGNADYKKQELDFWMRFMSDKRSRILLQLTHQEILPCPIARELCHRHLHCQICRFKVSDYNSQGF